VWFVVDVEPFESQFAQVGNESRDQFGPDPAALMIRGDRSIEQERVRSAIPDRVHESDEPVTGGGLGPRAVLSV
jgi:hypothetical protein